MAEPLTLATAIPLALTSSVFAAVMTQGLIWWREGRNNKREVNYLALRLATKFEIFAQDATTFMSQIADWESDNSKKVSTTLPDLQPLPSEQERWRDLDVQLSADVLGFEGLRRSQQDWIQEHKRTDPGEAPFEAGRIAVRLGMQAFSLATRLRSAYGLPPFDDNMPWTEYLYDEFQQLPDEFRLDETPVRSRQAWWRRLPVLRRLGRL